MSLFVMHLSTCISKLFLYNNLESKKDKRIEQKGGSTRKIQGVTSFGELKPHLSGYPDCLKVKLGFKKQASYLRLE